MCMLSKISQAVIAGVPRGVNHFLLQSVSVLSDIDWIGWVGLSCTRREIKTQPKPKLKYHITQWKFASKCFQCFQGYPCYRIAVASSSWIVQNVSLYQDNASKNSISLLKYASSSVILFVQSQITVILSRINTSLPIQVKEESYVLSPEVCGLSHSQIQGKSRVIIIQYSYGIV